MFEILKLFSQKSFQMERITSERLNERKQAHLKDILTSAANYFYIALFEEPEYRFTGPSKVVEFTIVSFLYKFDKLAEASLWSFINNIRNGVDPATALKSFIGAIDNELSDYVRELVDKLRALRCWPLQNHETLRYLIQIVLGLLKINLIYKQKLMGIEDDIYEDDEEEYLWRLLMRNPNIGDTLYQHFLEHQN